MSVCILAGEVFFLEVTVGFKTENVTVGFTGVIGAEQFGIIVHFVTLVLESPMLKLAYTSKSPKVWRQFKFNSHPRVRKVPAFS